MTNFWTRKKTGDIYKYGTNWADLIRECPWRSRLSPVLRCCNSRRLGGAGAGDITGNREGALEWQGENRESTASISQERDMHGEGRSGQLCRMLLRIWWEDDRTVPLNLAM